MTETKVWAKKSTFILAAAGSAIGLGNLWKFPYMVGENGGSAFVLVYLLCVLVIGLPLMMSETIVGKFSNGNAVQAIGLTAHKSNASQAWKGIAIMGIIAIFIILSFYSVIAGWAFDYTLAFASGSMENKQASEMGAFFGELLSDPQRLIMWQGVFIFFTGLIIALGAYKGIEKSLGIIMPILFLLLFIIVGYSSFATGEFKNTVTYMFSPDFSKITPMVVINAMGQAFFSLNLGICVIMTYAAYMQEEVSITRSSIYVASMDTLMAILAGFAIFPIVFANGLDASGGPGLLFVTLSTAFAQLGTVGTVLGASFFFLVILAALSSSISMVEPFVKWCEERFKLNRVVMTILYCLAAWGFGLITVFSFNIWAKVDVLGTGKTPFDLLDFVTSSVMLPLGGLLISLYVGWAMNTKISRDGLSTLGNGMFGLWLFTIRFVAPILILIIFISSVLGEAKMAELIGMITG